MSDPKQGMSNAAANDFEAWLAVQLESDRASVRDLLNDRRALHFLIAWSILESKCFQGFFTTAKTEGFAQELVRSGFDVQRISSCAAHFHTRYKDNRILYAQLLHGRDWEALTRIIDREFASLAPAEVVFLVAAVVYRFRNNIFHGNKTVARWLAYETEIRHCTEAMQAFVSHATTVRPKRTKRIS